MNKSKLIMANAHDINEAINPLVDRTTDNIQSEIDNLTKKFEGKYHHPLGEITSRDITDPIAIQIQYLQNELNRRANPDAPQPNPAKSANPFVNKGELNVPPGHGADSNPNANLQAISESLDLSTDEIRSRIKPHHDEMMKVENQDSYDKLTKKLGKHATTVESHFSPSIHATVSKLHYNQKDPKVAEYLDSLKK